MTKFTNRLNFSQKKESESAIKLHNRNRDFGYYYDNLCLYCANNDIEIDNISDKAFSDAVDLMEMHSTNDISTDHYYFWIE